LEASPAGQATAPSKRTLRLRVLAARGLLNTDTGLFGDVSDPYAVARLGGTQHRTPTVNNNLNPVWYDRNEFLFAVGDGPGSLELEVMNANAIRDDSLGRATLDVWSLLPNEWHKRTLPLEGRGCGEVEFEVRLDCAPPLAMNLLDPPRKPAAAVPSTSRVSGRIALPSDWADWDEAEDEAHSLEAGGWPADVRKQSVDAARPSSPSPAWSVRQRRASSSDSLMRSPRNRTFSVPDEFFEEPCLDMCDPASGPAAIWHASGWGPAAGALRLPWPGTVRALAELDEALQASAARIEISASAGCSFTAAQHESEDAAVAQALEREEAARRTAEAQLAQTLQRLKELDLKSVPSKARRPPGTATAAAAATGPDGLGSLVQPPRKSGGATATASAAPSASSTVPTPAPAAAGPKPANPAPAPTSVAPAAPRPAPEPKAAPRVDPAPKPSESASAATTPTPGASHLESCALMESKMAAVEVDVQSFKRDAAQKDFRLKVKKSLNTKVSQISATWNRITESTVGLCQELSNHTQDPSPARRRFAEYTMAERLVDEAEVGIKAQPRAVWPVAHVVARVFLKFPMVEELFLGLMYRACPYLVPNYAGSHLGRRGPAPGQRPEEAFIDFADRMVSYQRLWFAVLMTREELGPIWQWLARTLNERPAPITATLLHSALELVGADAQARYRRQFVKLVAYVDREYMEELDALQGRARGEEADQLRASQSRLRCWLDGFRQRGRAQPPAGRSIEVDEEEELDPNY